MTKQLTPLEALENIKEKLKIIKCDDYGICFYDGYESKEELSIIENSLKALEIIKKKKVDMLILLRSYDLYSYNSGFGYLPQEDILTQEEYDLLKEVLL